MAKLSRMKISGIRSFGCEAHDEQDILFTTPVSLFLGQNGCGKTTIIEAIKYATTGDLPNGSRQGQGFIYDPQMAQKSESRGQIKLKISDVKGKTLTIQKIAKVTQKASKLQYQLIDSTITRDHAPISNRCIDVHNEVCRSMGVSKAILNNVIFCHQEDSYWPLEEPKKLKERFDSIFDSVKYNKCIERIGKLKKQHSEKLKLLAKEVEFKKINKIQMEKKRDQLREKEDRIKDLENRLEDIITTVGPLQKKLEDIYIIERDIRKLENEADQLKAQIKNNKEQQSDILASITEIDCSDEELELKISSFETDTKKIQDQMRDLETEKVEVEIKEKKLRQEITKEQINLGKLQEEDKQNNNRLKEQQELIITVTSDYNIDEASNKEVSETIKIFERTLKTIEEKINDLDKTSEEEEKKLQEDIDNCRTKHVQLKHEVDTKTKLLQDLKSEKVKVKRRLNELNAFDDQLAILENRLTRAEDDLKLLESQVNTNDLKGEIEENKSKYENIEDQVQKVEKEIQVLQNYSSLQAELDLHNENLMKKQTDVKKLMYKHETNFEHIFENDIPETNLKMAVDKYLKKQLQVVNEKNNKINIKEKMVAKLETNLSVQKDKFKQMKLELIRDSKTIDENFQGKTFDEVEEEINNIIDDLQTQKGIFSNSIQMYGKFIQSFKKEKPCCPVCMRDVKEKRESTKIIDEIEKKITDFPNLAKQTETKLAEELKKQNKILQLKPMYHKVKQIEDTDMPTLKKQVSEMENELDESMKELELLKEEINTPKKNQELANSLISDAAFIDQYNLEIRKIQIEISSRSSRMPTLNSSRNIQDAYFEQENLKSKSKELRQKIDSLTDKLTKHNDRLQHLRDQKNDLKTKELKIKEGLQEKEQLESKKTETETKIEELNDYLHEAKTKIEPMKNELEKAIKIKEEKKKEDKKTRDNLGNLTRNFEKTLKDIKNLNEAIIKFNKKNVTDLIETVKYSLEKYNVELNNYSKIKNNFTKDLDGLKDQIINKKSYYRELLDNKKLRKKRSSLKTLLEDYQKLKTQLDKQDIIKVLREKQLLERKISDLNLELSQLNGKKSELDKSINESKRELSEPMYANANHDYKNKFIEHKILENVINDLDVFIRAVDWAMVQYHKQQMKYINEAVRDLWRSIYRGNDIDYIEIKTEMEKSKSTTSKRRTYEYRLVQVKNDVELEMRGRCSAGQKVLASLVIRIALADTFSTKCGILALDEPTTNLDKENIASLCEALCELINRKRNQDNFQLLIITHDQEFLERLGRAVLIESYNHVTRNEFGKSVVVNKPALF